MGNKDKPSSDAFAELVARPRRTGVHYLMYDPGDYDQYTALLKAEAIAVSEHGRKNTPDTAHKASAAATAAADARNTMGVIRFDLTALTRNEYEALVDVHQATDKQRVDHKASGNTWDLLLNPATFPAAIASLSVTKVTTPSGAVMDGITADQYLALYAAGRNTAFAISTGAKRRADPTPRSRSGMSHRRLRLVPVLLLSLHPQSLECSLRPRTDLWGILAAGLRSRGQFVKSAQSRHRI